ncbi:MAG: bifunctional UDP-N-acetylglucosamine diphosphorylase/glucosamine-1-phosphate N-acetyltransferase GlmU [Proteobacteria bacterium]|nr:bifunctional UDP-N-acetylglucosamine diphosphorylase/glucosamine-1-phosphate N-acetyltransferase GlmU [Pseudomonadota bacterium]
MSLSVIILAAGRGTRMGGHLPKVLYEVAGCTMLEHVLTAVQTLESDDIRVIVGPELLNHPLFIELKERYNFTVVLQLERNGTADAVRHGISPGHLHDKTLVVYGDTPMITGQLLKSLLSSMRSDPDAHIMNLGFKANNPYGYGRLIIGEKNALLSIVEEQDANTQQKAIDTCNSGIMLFNSTTLVTLLQAVSNLNAKGEYYLVDTVKLATQQGLPCIYMLCDESEVLGVNTYAQLAEAEMAMQNRIRKKMIDLGVMLYAPDTAFFAADTELEPGVKIHPYVVLGKNVKIAAGSEVYSFSHLEKVVVGNNCSIGPHARIREHVVLESDVRVGNFVELKKSRLGSGTKTSHLCYIGDADLGSGVNVGAGVVCANYDGFTKHKTLIEDGAFIGSNSSLVAPITISSNAVIAAGSTICEDVPPDALAIARNKQTNIEGRGMNHRRKKRHGKHG